VGTGAVLDDRHVCYCIGYTNARPCRSAAPPLRRSPLAGPEMASNFAMHRLIGCDPSPNAWEDID
jgi:hypothetical protein